MSDAFDYEGSLRVRVIAASAVRADDIISDEFSDEALDAISVAHEQVARYWLACGFTVIMESRNLDGSLAFETLLEPRPDLPEGFETVYRKEHP